MEDSHRVLYPYSTTGLKVYRYAYICRLISLWYNQTMKNPLLLFIIGAILLITAAVAYHKYCESKPDGCKKSDTKIDDIGEPREGIDW